MSHRKQRHENDCLNCGKMVIGRYCHDCGQENTEPHETFGHLVKHFIYDITHFDNKFFTTLKLLVFKPGFLAQEYISGKRAKYMNPIKMYVFTSAVFFVIFFSISNKKLSIDKNEPVRVSGQSSQAGAGHSQNGSRNTDENELVKGADLVTDPQGIQPASFESPVFNIFPFNLIVDSKVSSYQAYQSAQEKLPPGKRDGWFRKTLQKKYYEVNDKFRENPDRAANLLLNSFLHKLPYLLFVSLPVFALILKLLYFRQRRYYFVDHGVFSIHHYIFTFLLLLFVFMLDKLKAFTGWGFIDTLVILFFLSGGVYLYWSMRRFYGQRRLKTIIKFLLLNLAGMAMLIMLFLTFILFSIFEI